MASLQHPRWGDKVFQYISLCGTFLFKLQCPLFSSLPPSVGPLYSFYFHNIWFYISINTSNVIFVFLSLPLFASYYNLQFYPFSPNGLFALFSACLFNDFASFRTSHVSIESTALLPPLPPQLLSFPCLSKS